MITLIAAFVAGIIVGICMTIGGLWIGLVIADRELDRAGDV